MKNGVSIGLNGQPIENDQKTVVDKYFEMEFPATWRIGKNTKELTKLANKISQDCIKMYDPIENKGY